MSAYFFCVVNVRREVKGLERIPAEHWKSGTEETGHDSWGDLIHPPAPLRQGQLWWEERRQRECHRYWPCQRILKNNSDKTHTVCIMSAPAERQHWKLWCASQRICCLLSFLPHWATAAELLNSLDSYTTEDEMRKRRRRLRGWCGGQPGERKRLQALLKKAAPNGQEAKERGTSVAGA